MRGRIGTAVALALLGLCIAGAASADYAQSFSDLWDVNSGAVVVANSPTLFGDIRDMFGANDGWYLPERGHTLFADERPLDYPHWVEWQTPQAVTVGRVVLWAWHDPSGGRSFNRFSLEAWNDAGGCYTTIYDARVTIPYTYVQDIYGLLLDLALAPAVTASKFRATFYQGTTISYASGPRILELDAFAPVPEPSSIVALAVGLASLVGTKRRRK